MGSKAFQVALFISIGVHVALFSPIPGIGRGLHEDRASKVEITYIVPEKARSVEKEQPAQSENLTLKKELPKPVKTENTPATEKKELARGSLAEKAEKQAAPQAGGQAPIKRKVSALFSGTPIDLDALTLVDGDSESLNYLKAIRDKISGFVHRNYAGSMGEGEALVHFVLRSDGAVESAMLMSDNLSGNERLKGLCLDSIRRSSPFQPFPGSLDLATAAFKINISFKRR